MLSRDLLTTNKRTDIQTSVTLDNTSKYLANGLQSDYTGWTNGLTDSRAKVRRKGK